MIKLRTCFILIFLIINIFLFGQKQTETQDFNKWTFGTILVSETSWRPTLQSNFMPNVFPGIIAKYNLEQYSLRLGLEHIKTIYDPIRGNYYFGIDGFKRETLLRVGVEKGITIKHFLKPYVALDFFASKSYSDYFSSTGYTGLYFQTYISSVNIGVRPTVGIEFILSKSLSISFESNYDFQWSKRNIEQANLTLDEGFVNRVDNLFSRSFNSIGALSLNYHF
jgi:hypothetical protein